MTHLRLKQKEKTNQPASKCCSTARVNILGEGVGSPRPSAAAPPNQAVSTLGIFPYKSILISIFFRCKVTFFGIFF